MGLAFKVGPFYYINNIVCIDTIYALWDNINRYRAKGVGIMEGLNVRKKSDKEFVGYRKVVKQESEIDVSGFNIDELEEIIEGLKLREEQIFLELEGAVLDCNTSLIREKEKRLAKIRLVKEKVRYIKENKELAIADIELFRFKFKNT